MLSFSYLAKLHIFTVFCNQFIISTILISYAQFCAQEPQKGMIVKHIRKTLLPQIQQKRLY